MKKTVLFLALALISVATIAQTKKDSTKKAVKVPLEFKKSGAPKPVFIVDTARVFTINLKLNDVSGLMLTSEAGTVPLLKTTDMPMKQLDAALAYYNGIRQRLINQVNAQIRADTEKFKSDTAASNKAKPRR